MIEPNSDTVNSFLEEWNTLENYRLQEQSLGLLFNKFCPGNTTLEFVLLKVTALNQFYSTYILDTYSVAKHIQQMDIDRRLENHDRLLVNELALIRIKGKQKTFTRSLQNIAVITFLTHSRFTIPLWKKCSCATLKLIALPNSKRLILKSMIALCRS